MKAYTIVLASMSNRGFFQDAEEGAGFAPSFVEKPRIIPNESGTLITMKCKCKANPKPEVTWFRGTNVVKESSKISIKTKTVEEDIYELIMEIKVIFEALENGQVKLLAFPALLQEEIRCIDNKVYLNFSKFHRFSFKIYIYLLYRSLISYVSLLLHDLYSLDILFQFLTHSHKSAVTSCILDL